MSTTVPTKAEIRRAIERLRPDQLARLWQFLQRLGQETKAPVYRIHEHAISTGISDLAERHDDYLYGQKEPDA